MSQSRSVSPLLKPKHFEGLSTKLTNQRIRFNAEIGPDERTDEIFQISEGERDIEDVLMELEQLRPFTKVISNPRKPSARALLKSMSNAQKSLTPDEAISISYGLPSKYDLKWSRERTENGEDSEGQSFVLVAFDHDEPVGFAGLGITLMHDDQREQIYISHSLDLIYVPSNQRGKGFGIDLSIACGYLCRDVFVATYHAAPVGSTITPMINADYESEGGERFTIQLASALDFQADILRMAGKRKSITVESAEVDAGY